MKIIQILLILVASLGFVLIGASAVFAGGTVCLDDTSFCNDFKLDWEYSDSGEIFEIHGYEYGCGHDNRQVAGTGQFVSGPIFQIGLTGVANSSQIFGTDITLNLGSNTATGPYYYADESGWTTGTSNYNLIPCSVAFEGKNSAPDRTE